MTDLVPWAIQAGSRCADLMCLHYENHFQVTCLFFFNVTFHLLRPDNQIRLPFLFD